jgi:hypothetical protein
LIKGTINELSTLEVLANGQRGQDAACIVAHADKTHAQMIPIVWSDSVMCHIYQEPVGV